jgi:hypothetical protein
MAFIAAETSNYSPLDQGDYLTRCVSVWYLGLQSNNLEPTKPPRPRIGLEFEVFDQFLDNGLPRKLYGEFTLSLHKQSALRPFLETWRGKPFDANTLAEFDVSKVLSVPAKVIVVHRPKASGGVRAVIQTAFPVKDKSSVPPPLSPLLLFDADNPDPAVLAQLPDFVRAKIAQAVKPAPAIPPAQSSQAANPEPFDDTADLSF